MLIAPNKAGKKRNDQELPAIMTTIGSAPAGGWVVLVNTIQEMDKPTPSAIAHMELPNKWNMTSPIKVEIKCPPITFLGCDKGASHNA